MENAKATESVEVKVKTSGFFKIKKGLARQAFGICEIVAGIGDEIQGTLQLPLDAVNGINSKIESVKKVKTDIKNAVQEEITKTAAKVTEVKDSIKAQILDAVKDINPETTNIKTVEGVIA